jgi:hypothetical protein
VLSSGRGNGEPLDPDGASPDGSKALAQVLRSHGVDVQVERSAAGLTAALDARPTATVLVSRADLLAAADLTTLRSYLDGPQTTRRLVLVTALPAQLARLAPDVRIVGAPTRHTASADCADPAALRAGRADAGGLTYGYQGSAPAVACYPVDGHPSYLVRGSGPQTVVIGQPSGLTNDRLAKQGNASLMFNTLATTGDVIWYVPSADLLPGQQQSLTSLLPHWVLWVTLQLFVVAGLCVLWRGRRLGRLVPEPLPVVVRAVETTEGRARMYRRARAQDRAAAQLREATMTRIRAHTGLPRSASPADLVAVVATRTGLPGPAVADLLLGPPPLDDAGLVALAQNLDRLDREVRRP